MIELFIECELNTDSIIFRVYRILGSSIRLWYSLENPDVSKLLSILTDCQVNYISNMDCRVLTMYLNGMTAMGIYDYFHKGFKL